MVAPLWGIFLDDHMALLLYVVGVVASSSNSISMIFRDWVSQQQSEMAYAGDSLV